MKCIVRDCENEVHPKRWAIGLHTCIEDHAEKRRSFMVDVPYGKGACQHITEDQMKEMFNRRVPA